MRTAILVLALSTTQAHADIRVDFRESAPKDSFTITNVSNCPSPSLTLTIDLSGSKAGLIFDTSGSGAGVEVFQPLEIAKGGEHIVNTSTPTDGDTELEIALNSMAPNATTTLTIDLDDTLTQSDLGQIRVSGAEIAGASISAIGTSALFDASAEALLKTPQCDQS